MPLIQLVIVLVVVGVVLWVINSYIPMQATIKKLLRRPDDDSRGKVNQLTTLALH